ncbi:hypothetical protein [Deinococcus sp.]|uniref:hypothetical protein n=1 Tax=Deinococcus sp. TaxID=47478 RepID=UPI0025BE175B|nr:hypothetical protein [Deinococcus sp.]
MKHLPLSTPPSSQQPCVQQPCDQQPGSCRTYEAPRVQDLGAWQAVTLIASVGFNSFPGLPGQENNRGSY